MPAVLQALSGHHFFDTLCCPVRKVLLILFCRRGNRFTEGREVTCTGYRELEFKPRFV